MVKNPEIQKYPEGTLLKDLNSEVAWDFHWKLHHVLSCAHVWALNVSLILLPMNTSQDTLIYI